MSGLHFFPFLLPLLSAVAWLLALDVFLIFVFFQRFFFLSPLHAEQEPSQIAAAEAGPSWAAPAELLPKAACLPTRQLKGQRLGPTSRFL